MIVAHIFGIPVEESVLQLAGTGMATVTFFVVAGRATVGRLRRRRPRAAAARSTRDRGS